MYYCTCMSLLECQLASLSVCKTYTSLVPVLCFASRQYATATHVNDNKLDTFAKQERRFAIAAIGTK